MQIKDVSKKLKKNTNTGSALRDNIHSNSTKPHPYGEDEIKKTPVKKARKSTRKKLDPLDVKNQIITFKVSKRELAVIQSKITLDHNNPNLIARHYLKEFTELFTPNK